MQEPWDRISKDQTISFSELGRYSRCTQTDYYALPDHQGLRVLCGADLLNTPLHDTARKTPAGRSFDTHKARAVLERQ